MRFQIRDADTRETIAERSTWSRARATAVYHAAMRQHVMLLIRRRRILAKVVFTPRDA